MSSVTAEELINDPIALAIAVLADRVRSLPREDRNDLFELAEALIEAKTDEEFGAAARGMREILKQQTGGVRQADVGKPGCELQKWMDYVGDRIRHFREQAGYTQEELAKKSGLPQSHISRLERAHHSPSAVTLEKIAKALGISAFDLDPSL